MLGIESEYKRSSLLGLLWILLRFTEALIIVTLIIDSEIVIIIVSMAIMITVSITITILMRENVNDRHNSIAVTRRGRT